MLIEEFSITNIRGLTYKHTFNLDDKPAPWLMFLGANGTGKTSVLQGLALALLNSWKGLGIDSNSFVAPDQTGSITIKLTGLEKPIDLIFNKGDIEHSYVELPIPIIGYGAVRLLPKRRQNRRNLKRVNVRNLFATSTNAYFIQHPREWMYDNKDIIEAVSKVILDVLPFSHTDIVDLQFDEVAKDVYLIVNKRRIDLHELSSGYMSIIAVAVDIMHSTYWFSRNGHLAEGIVLIDEIDAHLHPSWKMRIVSQLRRAFPRMQFIVTSHDPLCLRGMQNGEIAVIQKNEQSAEVLADVPDPKGLRLDQILTSDLFGMNSTVDPLLDDLIHEYHKLLNIKERSISQEERLRNIMEILDGSNVKYFGFTNRERMVYQVIDESIARNERQNKPRHKLDTEAQVKLLNLWGLSDEEHND